LDLDYSPNGREIVTGSFDKTIRIFNVHEGHSREVYHTKRMQHAFCVKYSMDAKFVLSGSDDGNIRIWKANASDKISALSRRETASLQYAESLKEKYGHIQEIRRIAKYRKVPAAIKNTQNQHRTILESEKRKEENRRKHQATEETNIKVPPRQKVVIAVQK